MRGWREREKKTRELDGEKQREGNREMEIYIERERNGGEIEGDEDGGREDMVREKEIEETSWRE